MVEINLRKEKKKKKLTSPSLASPSLSPLVIRPLKKSLMNSSVLVILMEIYIGFCSCKHKDNAKTKRKKLQPRREWSQPSKYKIRRENGKERNERKTNSHHQ
jgi:hypothetical protein